MPLIKDISGQKFGSLTVLKLIGKDKHSKSLWECQCECGGTTVVTSNNLNRGITKSCGCRHTLFKTNETGNRYGRLLIVGPADKGGWWKFRFVLSSQWKRLGLMVTLYGVVGIWLN